MKAIIFSIPVVLLLSGCGWATYDRNDTYLNAATIDRVTIPPGLDQPEFEDALTIPEVKDVRELAGQKMEVGLPDSLGGALGVDQIIIKRLGDTRWVFVDAPPAMVWPKLKQFWENNNLPLETTDPSRGMMDSVWLTGRDGDAEAIFASLGNGSTWANSGATTKHKFRVRIEPGIRPGSTEVYLEQKSLPLGVPVRIDAVDWNGISDDGELEGVALNKLAFYLGDHLNTSTQISKLAATIGGQRVELVPDRQKPVLKYKLKFDRAWATVGNALEDARIDVENPDVEAGTYYVYYDDAQTKEPGFFGRLFSDEEHGPEDLANRYLVHLDNKDDEVHVTVMKDAATFADALVAERLLKIIKQYST